MNNNERILNIAEDAYWSALTDWAGWGGHSVGRYDVGSTEFVKLFADNPDSARALGHADAILDIMKWVDSDVSDVCSTPQITELIAHAMFRNWKPKNFGKIWKSQSGKTTFCQGRWSRIELAD